MCMQIADLVRFQVLTKASVKMRYSVRSTPRLHGTVSHKALTFSR